MRYLLALFLLVLASLAQAYPATSGTIYTVNGGAYIGTGSSKPAACAHWGSLWVAGNPAYAGAVGQQVGSTDLCQLYSSPVCGGQCVAALQPGISSSSGYTCPGGGTLSGSTCSCGSGEYDTGSACAPTTSCSSSAGTQTIMNRTEGWAISANTKADDYVSMESSPPTTLCDGSCESTVTGVDSCWRSQVPSSTGLHRVSCDYKVTTTHSTCSTKTDGTDSSAPPAACPGYVGQVNGKAVCVGTSSTPLPSASAPSGTPPEGYGNPGAGTKPDTGPGSGTGSGRTPTTGDGGPSGGGSSAATPGGGSEGNGVTAPGTVEIELRTCGRPGEPPCKIDETGTPSATGAYSGAQASLDSAAAAHEGAISGAGSSVTGLSWAWSFTLPEGTCEAFVMDVPVFGDFTLDPCASSGVAVIRQLLAYAFFAMGALYMWRSVTASAPGAK